jgi:hypothetical protein
MVNARPHRQPPALLAQTLSNAAGALEGICILTELVEAYLAAAPLSIAADRGTGTSGGPCLAPRESACLKPNPARNSPTGLIKHCSRVLDWSRLSCTISRYPRSHDYVPCPCSMVTIVKSHPSCPASRFTAVKRVMASEIQCIRCFGHVDRLDNAFLFLHRSYFSTTHSFPSPVSVVALIADIIVLPSYCSLWCASTALTCHSLSPRRTLFALQSLPCG